MLTQARFAAVANERFVVSMKKMKQRSSFFLLVQNCIDFCVVSKDFKTSYDLCSSLSIHKQRSTADCIDCNHIIMRRTGMMMMMFRERSRRSCNTSHGTSTGWFLSFLFLFCWIHGQESLLLQPEPRNPMTRFRFLSRATNNMASTRRSQLPAAHESRRSSRFHRTPSYFSAAAAASSSSSSSSSSEEMASTTSVLTSDEEEEEEDPTSSVPRSASASMQTVAVVGSGAVGCYYGARLWEVGHGVQFYMRPGEHFDASRQHGLSVTSMDGNVAIGPDELEVYNSTQDMIGPFDWVLVALKSYSLDAIPELILPLLSPLGTTRVLVVMNGLIEDDLIQLLKKAAGESDNPNTPLQCCQALYGGMALLCSNRIKPGCIDHSYAGLLSVGVASSTQSTDLTEDRQAIEDLFRYTKVPLVYEPCLLKGRWRKMIWNLAFNGLSTVMGGGWTVDCLVKDPALRQLANAIMDETIAAGNADLARKYGPNNFEPLVAADKDPMMALSDNMGPYKTSTMLDLTNRRPMEVQYLFQVPVQRARELQVPIPHLETIVAQIEALQRHYNL